MRAIFLSPSLASLLLLGLSACSNDGGDDASHAARGGTAREFERTDSEVTVLPTLNGRFAATQTVTISNDDAGAGSAVVAFDNENGSIASSPTTAGYQVQVTLQAEAPTEEHARAALASMTVEHRDGVDPGVLYLDNRVNWADYDVNNVTRNATVAAALPGTLDYRLYETSINGAVGSSGLNGSEAQVETVNGAASLAGSWSRAAVNAVNGTCTVSGDLGRIQASSVNGAVQATLSSLRDTQADFDSVNGSIDVTVTQAAGVGFDLEALTDLGSATIVVAGTEPVGTQSATHAHYRSPEYADSNPQVSVDARTSAASVQIHD